MINSIEEAQLADGAKMIGLLLLCMGYRQAKKLQANDERMSQASMANFGDLIFYLFLTK
jgi:hypothetical protein